MSSITLGRTGGSSVMQTKVVWGKRRWIVTPIQVDGENKKNN